MEIKVTTEGVVFKPFKFNIQLEVQTAEEYADLIQEGVNFSVDNGVITNSDGITYPILMEVTKSIFNSLNPKSTKEGEKSQS